MGTHAPDYRPMDYYSMADEEQDLAEWLAGQAGLVDEAEGENEFSGAYEADVIDLAGAIPDESSEAG